MLLNFDDNEERIEESTPIDTSGMSALFDISSVPENPHVDNPDTPSQLPDGSPTVWSDIDNRQFPYYDASTGIPEPERAEPVRVSEIGLLDEDGVRVSQQSLDNSVDYRPEKLDFLHHCADLGDAQVCRLDPFFLQRKGEWFQYKQSNVRGVTGVLDTVRSWRNDLSGMAFVWVDTDGTPYVVDGHQRLDLARRLKGRALARGDNETADNIYITAKVWRHDSPDFEIPGQPGKYVPREEQIEQMKIRAAMKNIAEKTGTVLDAANVLRALRDPKYENTGLIPDSDMFSVKNELIQKADKLSRLSDEAYNLATQMIGFESSEASVNLNLESEAIDWVLEYAPNDGERQVQILKEMSSFLADHGEMNSIDARNIAHETSKLFLRRGAEDAQAVLVEDKDFHVLSAIDEKSKLQQAAESFYRKEKSDLAITSFRTDEASRIARINKQRAADADAALRLLRISTWAELDGFFDHHALQLKRYKLQNPQSDSVKENQYIRNQFLPDIKDIILSWDNGGREKVLDVYGGYSAEELIENAPISSSIIDDKRRDLRKKEELWDNDNIDLYSRRLQLEREVQQLAPNLERAKKAVLLASSGARSRRNLEFDDIRAEIQTRKELIDRYWIDENPDRKADLTPDINKTPPELKDYVNSVPYAIGSNPRYGDAIDSIYAMGSIKQKMHNQGISYDDLSDEEIQTYIDSLDVLHSILNDSDVALKNIITTNRRDIGSYYADRRRERRETLHKERLDRDVKPLLESLKSDIGNQLKLEKARELFNILEDIEEIKTNPEYIQIRDEAKSIASEIPGYAPTHIDKDISGVGREAPVRAPDAPVVSERRTRQVQGYERGNRWASIDDGGNPDARGYRVKNLATWYFDSDIARAVVRVIEAKQELEEAQKNLDENNNQANQDALEKARDKFTSREENLVARRLAAGMDAEFDYPDYATALEDAAHLSNIAAKKTVNLYPYTWKQGSQMGKYVYGSWHKEMWDAYGEFALDSSVFDDRSQTSYYTGALLPADWNVENTSGAIKDYVDKLEKEGYVIDRLAETPGQYSRASKSEAVVKSDRSNIGSTNIREDIDNDKTSSIQQLRNISKRTKPERDTIEPALDALNKLQNTNDIVEAYKLHNDIKQYAQKAQSLSGHKQYNRAGGDPPGPRLKEAAALLTKISSDTYADVKKRLEGKETNEEEKNEDSKPTNVTDSAEKDKRVSSSQGTRSASALKPSALKPADKNKSAQGRLFRVPLNGKGRANTNGHAPKPMLPTYGMGESGRKNAPPKIINDFIKRARRKPRRL